jgi:hypothetical protein
VRRPASYAPKDMSKPPFYPTALGVAGAGVDD